MSGLLSASKIRDELAIDHIDTPYYDDVESQEMLDIFWEKESIFYNEFKNLDLTAVLELAAGHGRHSAQIIGRAGSIVLVDVNISNIEFCSKRFYNNSEVRCVTNSGSDLKSIESASMTSLFSYDAIVHFEASDVISYVYEISRVLKPGGRALIHYSNNENFPQGTYKDCPRWRSFFSEKMFRHFASRAGLLILSSQTLPWPPMNRDNPYEDALTLVEKPR